MSDTREALTRLISEAVALAAKTSPGINPEGNGEIIIDWQHGLPDFVAALDSLALVVPRMNIDPDTVADEFGIQGLTIDNGAAVLATTPTSEQARKLVLAMSLACGRMLDDDQAPNYVEFEVSPANRPGYVVHVRRAVGPSPHTLRREAEARAERAEAALAAITEEGQR